MTAQIHDLSATVGLGCTVRLGGDSGPPLATNATITLALSIAAIKAAPVEVELFEGQSVIKRVLPFFVNEQPAWNQITRIATQMNPATGEHWLEVFIKGSDKSLNATDPIVQHLVAVAALRSAPISFKASDAVLTSLSIELNPG
jgi:hypothetical protein